jgi:hypothetical protein
MYSMMEVLESARWVSEKSRWVEINEEGIKRFALQFINKEETVPPWDDFHHFSGPAERVAAYILVLDTINFCFWSLRGHEPWKVDINGGTYSGYNGLAIALNKAMASGVPLDNADFLEDMTEKRLRGIIGGSGALQLMGERAMALKELGHVLNRDYQGDAWRLFETSGEWTGGLVRLLAKKLGSYRDVAVYRERAVYFYKRGQILCADLHGALGGKGWGRFHDMDKLTAFADYKLPQVLRNLGILLYAEPLSGRVDSMDQIDPGSPEEIEIRANTIIAVENIKNKAKDLGFSLKSCEIDGILWQMGQGAPFKERPYHRTPTIFY